MSRTVYRWFRILSRVISGLLLITLLQGQADASDPWKTLQDIFKRKPAPTKPEKQESTEDPWAKLRAIYLPFSEETETAALTDPAAGSKVSGYLHRVLRSYEKIINEASQRFNIPREIIGAVIMVESGGDPNAKAKTSTASGLMQTVKGTFQEARKGLRSMEVTIDNNPFNPRSSIIAGSWYLDRMYEQAVIDRKKGPGDRKIISSWRYPVEYYYAGPGNAKKAGGVVIMYAGGRKVVIDKPAYSRKVMRWARIMARG